MSPHPLARPLCLLLGLLCLLASCGDGQEWDTGDPHVECPTFPSPAPNPTSAWVLNDLDTVKAFAEGSGAAPVSLGDVHDKLATGMSRAGFDRRSSYCLPNRVGFAIAAAFEQIDEQARRFYGEKGWAASQQGPTSIFSLLRDILFVQPGNFRMMVLYVQPRGKQRLTAKEGFEDKDEALLIVDGGTDLLPEALRAVQRKSWKVELLVYEFTQADEDQPAVQVESKQRRWQAATHLSGSCLQAALERLESADQIPWSSCLAGL